MLNPKGWAVTIKEPLELKNVTLSKALRVCSVQKSGHFFITWVGSHKMFIATRRHVDLCFHPKRGPDWNELDCLIGHLFSMITLVSALSDLRSLEWCFNENQIWFNIFSEPNISKYKSLMYEDNKINLGISCWSNMRFITHNCYEEHGISCIMDYAGEIWCVRQKVKALT